MKPEQNKKQTENKSSSEDLQVLYIRLPLFYQFCPEFIITVRQTNHRYPSYLHTDIYLSLQRSGIVQLPLFFFNWISDCNQNRSLHSFYISGNQCAYILKIYSYIIQNIHCYSNIFKCLLWWHSWFYNNHRSRHGSILNEKQYN